MIPLRNSSVSYSNAHRIERTQEHEFVVLAIILRSYINFVYVALEIFHTRLRKVSEVTFQEDPRITVQSLFLIVSDMF